MDLHLSEPVRNGRCCPRIFRRSVHHKEHIAPISRDQRHAQPPRDSIRTQRNVQRGWLMRPRHATALRITHWIHTVAFIGLLVSGVAILIAHPRLYWGETGAFGSPALIELPLPLNLDQSGWGRSLHFLAAWVCVLNGAVYVISGMLSRHFKTDVLPHRTDMALNPIWKRISDAVHWRKPVEE